VTSAPAVDADGAAPPPPAPTVTLDVWRLRPLDVVRAMAASPTWTRRSAARSGGRVGFARLLGTGSSRFTPTSADLTRWVTLTVWAPSAAGSDPVPPAWARHAVDHWRARLVPLSSRGQWAGRAPFEVPPRAVASAWTGEVLALTRARLRPQRALSFWRAIPPVALALGTTDGLRATMGVGEAPLGYQGTMSLWRDPAAVAAFAWRDPAHRAVVDRTPREHWYAEELFARFAVLDRTDSLGVWADRTPGTGRAA
jgi:hypothetical protein